MQFRQFRDFRHCSIYNELLQIRRRRLSSEMVTAARRRACGSVDEVCGCVSAIWRVRRLDKCR